MSIRYLARWILAVLVALTLVAPHRVARAQRADQAALARTIPLTRLIPLDPDLLTHTLANGVRTYVRANAQPRGLVEFRLVVKAGSVLEEEDERGFAHFIEHMAFHGTSNMRPGLMRTLLASIGATSSGDSNGSTNYDQTVYQLRVPTNPNNIAGAIQILADLVQEIAFRPDDVESERPILLEEIRQRDSAATRMFPVLLKGTRYAERSPSGLSAVIRTATPARLRAFYEKWYRPELTAVIAVGDFNAPDVNQLIDTRFSAIRGRSGQLRRPTFTMPDHDGTRYVIATDKQNTTTRVEVHHLLPSRDLTTVDGYRRKILDRLFTGMVSARFVEAARQSDAPFSSAGAARGPFLVVRAREDASFVAVARDNRIEPALAALIEEAKRIERFGFSVTELERQKQATLRVYERAVTVDRTRDSASRAAEYIRNFTEEERLPTADFEYALHQRFLPDMTVGDINQLAGDWVAEENRTVLVTAPEKDGVSVADETALAAIVGAAAARTPTRYDDGGSTRTDLLETEPVPGTIVRTVTHPELNVTEWTLSNGVTVVLRSSQARADEVVMRAVRLGGGSTASDDDYPSAMASASIVAASGAGRFDPIALQRALTGKVVSVSVSVAEFEEGLAGTASSRDLRTLLQLIHLRLTAPRASEEVFRAVRQQMNSTVSGAAANPDYQFQLATLRVLTHDSPRRLLASTPDPDRWNLDAALAFYRRRFGNANGFTFVFVGDTGPDTMRPLVSQYLGSLPSTGRADGWKDDGVRAPSGVVEQSVTGGIEDRSRVSLIFSAPYEPSERHRAVLTALAGVVGSRLNSALRDRLGGTYGVTVRENVTRLPVPAATMTISWTCDPHRSDELVRVVLSDLVRFRATTVPAAVLYAQKDLMQRQLDQTNRQNAAMAAQIAQKYEYGEDVTELAALPEIYRHIDADTIQRAAQQYLDPGQFVQVVMVPRTAAR